MDLRNKTLWLFFGAFLIIASVLAVKSFLDWQSTNFSCDGDLIIHQQDTVANITIKYIFNGNKGVALVRGEIIPRGLPVQMINQNVFFDAERKRNDYFLVSSSVLDNTGGTSEASVLKAVIPQFYLQPEVKFYLNIERLSGNSWLFSTSRTPSLFCSV